MDGDTPPSILDLSKEFTVLSKLKYKPPSQYYKIMSFLLVRHNLRKLKFSLLFAYKPEGFLYFILDDM